jgi:hypothetical protein
MAACQFQRGDAEGKAGDAARFFDAAADAPADVALDAPPPLCAGSAPRLDETFDAPPVCPLGTSGGNAMMALVQGTLQISTATNGQNSFCNEPNPASWSGNGVTVEVPSVMTGNNAWTSFQVLGVNMAITEKNNFLLFTDNGGGQMYSMVAFDATTMRWWRLRPDAGNTNVIAEYSPDRITWTMLGTHTGGGMIRVQLIAGTDGTASPAGASQYDNLVACP